MTRTCGIVHMSLLAVATLTGIGFAAAQQAATLPAGVTPPQSTVPEIFTLMGEYVRVAYNNEGYATLGYRVANDSIGTEWMLLDAGVTVRKGTDTYALTRDAISLKTPDGKTIPLATQQEYADAHYLQALNKRAKMMRDTISYFPLDASHACAMRFFGDLSAPASSMSYDRVELAYDRACVGRLFFKIPGGIKVGQHWLVIKFAGSELEVPFRILTKEEEKFLRKEWKNLKKAHEEALKQ